MEDNKKIHKNIVKGKIANAITSAAKNHIVATTDDLYDTNFFEYQDEINKKLRLDIDAIDLEIETINTHIGQIDSEIGSLKSELVTVNSKISDINVKIDVINSDIDVLQENVTSIDGRVVVLENKAESMQSEIVSLQSMVENINSRLENAEGDIVEINNSITEICSGISLLNLKVDEIDESIIEIRVDISGITSTISNLSEKIDSETQARIVGDEALQTIIYEEVGKINSAITDIESVIATIDGKIPEEASSENQLADKEYVNNLISKSSSYFRGSWANWTSVPTNSNEYPEDTNGNRIPRLGDYLVIEDASDYDVESGLTGTWRFTYSGAWETDNKSGWVKEYRINEEPEVTISFYSKFEGEDDSEATFITQKKVVKTDTLSSYPELTETEFKDGGYWDTPITELRNIVEDKRVTYIIPISINSQLIELCFENNWCSSLVFITTDEMENLTNE